MRVRDQAIHYLREHDFEAAERSGEVEKSLFIVAIGGDGTILKAANVEAERQLGYIEIHKSRTRAKPILGINCGTRGFLASVHCDEDWQSRLDQALAGNYFAKRRARLALRVDREERQVCGGNALNEIHFGRIDEHVVSPQIHVTGLQYPLNLSRGDGIIISTATGSTAYCSSAFGQVTNRQDRFVVTVICPTDRQNGHSELIDANQNCYFDVPSRQRMYVEIDGRRVFVLKPGDQVTIKKSAIATYIMEFGDEII